MKKTIAICLCVLAAACNNSNKNTTTTTDSTGNDTMNNTTDNTGTRMDTTGMNGNTNTNGNMNNSGTPFDPSDTTFVMKAAIGGQEEVDLGNLASQQAASERVKAFGSMMVRDHTNANQELMNLANSHGLNVSSTLPNNMQKDKTNLTSKQGAAFDKAYMNMMVSDHRKDIAEFEKASKNAKDAQLKDFATRTLPTLKMHLDSAIAVQKSLK
jgi:putative membrane protein